MPVIVREYYQPGAPDPVLEDTLVLTIARRHVPSCQVVTGVDESGGEARVYLIDQDVVLKTQRPQQLRSWTSLEKEVAFLRELERQDPEVPVPRVLGYGREGSVEYTLLTRMDGDAAIRAGIPAEARPETLRALGRTIRRIHALKQAPLLATGLFPEEYTAEDLRITVAEDIAELAGLMERRQIAWPLPVRPDELARLATRRIPDTTLGVALHSNPGPTHTFVIPETGRYVGLIDFGDAYIGHPAFDLCRWPDPGDREHVVAGYLEAGHPGDGFDAVLTVAMALSDLSAVLRQRPHQARSAAHLSALVESWRP
jgi:hygromycin-B 7''-O-kinase